MLPNKYKVIFVLLIALIASIYLVFGFYDNSKQLVERPLEKVIGEHPELNSYIGEAANKSTIELEANDAYFVAFVDYGTGLGITAAKCYKVTQKGEIEFINQNQFPPFDDLLVTKLDPQTCLPEFTELPKGF